MTETFLDNDATLRIDGPAGALELAIDVPEAGVPRQPVVAVVCHPLSTEGGSLHNKVVTMAARALRESGVTTVRMNFRGVGNSEGRFDEGEGELDDLATVVAWVRERKPGHALWLAGFSFGAYVTLRGAVPLAADALISIAPPVGRSWDFSAIATPQCPWLVIQGEADEIVDATQVYEWLDSLDDRAQPPELVRVPETSHFFHHRLMDLRGAVKAGVRRWLPGTPA